MISTIETKADCSGRDFNRRDHGSSVELNCSVSTPQYHPPHLTVASRNGAPSLFRQRCIEVQPFFTFWPLAAPTILTLHQKMQTMHLHQAVLGWLLVLALSKLIQEGCPTTTYWLFAGSYGGLQLLYLQSPV